MTEPLAASAEIMEARTQEAQRELWRLERAISRLKEKHPEVAGRRKAPAMPPGLFALGAWLRQTFDLWSEGTMTKADLAECRRQAASVFDRYKTGAIVRQSKAALRSAEAQAKIATALGSLEYGGAAAMWLARYQELPGETRPLPFRRSIPATPPAENGT